MTFVWLCSDDRCGLNILPYSYKSKSDMLYLANTVHVCISPTYLLILAKSVSYLYIRMGYTVAYLLAYLA